MASTYSTNLKLELQATGENSGSWGDITNTNLGTLIEQAISGYVTQAITDGSGANTTITIPNGATGVARNMCIEMSGALTFSTCSLIVPANKKLYFIYNNTTGGQPVTVKVSGLTGVSVPNGAKVLLVCNGTDVVNATNYMASLTVGGALTLSTPLPASSGGTGLSALGTGVATFLGTPSSANLAAALTDETGSGSAVFASSPTLITPNIGTPSAGVLTNCTGYPGTSLTVIDAKGDLIVGTAADTAARLAVGTDFFDVAADSSQTTGLVYRKPAGAVASGYNIAARTNAGTPNSKIDITANEIVLRATNGGAVVAQSVSVTIDITVSGANGLDTGSEASNTWYYGYVIAKPDGTVAGLLSATAGTPASLPAGYTLYAQVTAVRNDGSSNFIKYQQQGNAAFFNARQSILSAGTATVETSVSTASFVPPGAEGVSLSAYLNANSTAGGFFSATAELRYVSGSTLSQLETIGNFASDAGRDTLDTLMPNVSQNVYYILSSGGSINQNQLSLWVRGFVLPGCGA